MPSAATSRRGGVSGAVCAGGHAPPRADELHIDRLGAIVAPFGLAQLKFEYHAAAGQVAGVHLFWQLRVVKEHAVVGRLELARVDLPQLGRNVLHVAQEAIALAGVVVAHAAHA